MRIVETLNRGLVRALRSQFRNPHEAVRELVDNALDHRLGERIKIEIDCGPNKLAVTNFGGRGMGAEELGEFVCWGSSQHDSPNDIGMYGQGGKAACAYLGRGYRILCRRSGTSEIFVLEDDDILGRTEPKDFGELLPLARELRPSTIRDLPQTTGFVRLEILQPNITFGLEPEDLVEDISAVYGRLISANAIEITVNDINVQPRVVELDRDVPEVPIEVVREDLRIVGWVGKLWKTGNRGRCPKPGISFFWQGRRIEEGQWLSANQYGKGSLSAFYGELIVSGDRWRPNLNKTAFTVSGTSEWREVGEEIIRQARPVLDMLRSGSDSIRVTSRDRSMARQVRGELQQVLVRLLSTEKVKTGEGHTTLKGGRAWTYQQRGGRRGIRGSASPRKLRGRKVDVPRMPEILIDNWEGPARAETRESNGRVVVAINKRHPAYNAANARFAIAEGAILECLRAGELHGIDEFLSLADEALADWGRLQQESRDE